MIKNKLTMGFAVCGALLLSLAFARGVNASTPGTPEDWRNENIIGSWETAININEDAQAVVTRVLLNNEGNTAIKLTELMAGLKYAVEWNGANRCISLKNDKNNIRIYVGSGYCEKNGERISLNGAAFIAGDYSYCSLSFLENVLEVETVSIEKSEWNNRINGITLNAPELPPSSRKPFPETKIYVDGMPLYIDYAENLKESLPYNTGFLVCDGINGKSENVIIYTEATLRNFKISGVKYNEMFGGFTEGSIILTPRDVSPPLAVLLNTTVPEGIPVEAVTFTDSKGKTYTYQLGYNGKDGTVSALEMTFR